MYFNPKRLRRPEERVGTLANAALPPPEESPRDSDESLVRALRARDERAFEDLIARYYPSMLRLATSIVRSHEEADEVIQETWIAVLSGIDRFEHRASFKTWLFRILENRARTRAKREARMLPFSSFGAPPPDELAIPIWSRAPSRANTPEDNLLAEELRSRIEHAVAALPRSQHEVLTLRDIEGRSAEEVCTSLDLSATNQRVLLHRARAHVRRALSPYVDNLPDPASLPACA